MINSILRLLILTSLLATQLLAMKAIEVTSLESTKDCGPLTHEVNQDPIDSSMQCLRVYFDNFATASGEPGAYQRNCHMKARLRIPANTEFRASEAIAEGVYKMQGQAYGGLALSYELSSLGAIGNWFESFRPMTFGDFNLTAKLNTETFTVCRGYETEVELSSDLHAFIDQRDVGTSLVSLDETGKRLSWNWQIRPCIPDLYAEPFLSYYWAPNHRRYQAIIHITGDRGTFESSANFTGRLYNIVRSDSGRVAEGEWSGLTSSGRFRFQITDPTTGAFTGIWRDSQGRQGDWYGEYLR